ncbi:MAG: cytochrome c biogenesis CcdA family protein [Candidatus Hodarchaeales archaeon]
MGHKVKNNRVYLVYIFGNEIPDSLGLPLFFLAGLYVALSPCLFPIMPMTIFRIMSKDTVDSEGNISYPSRKESLRWVSILVSGIMITFVTVVLIIMYIWREFGVQINYLRSPLSYLLGVILVLMGIFILFPKLSERTFARIPIPQKVSDLMVRDEYKQLDLFIIGLGYSVIALPCIFAVFLALVTIIISTANPIFTFAGLVLFGIGLYIPYLILVLITAEARFRAASSFSGKFRYIEILMGVLIVIFGLLFLWPAFGGPFIFSLA